MTNADCWARVVEARTKRERLMPQRVWTLHKGEHAAVIDVKAGAGHRCGNRAHGRQEWLVWWSSTRSKRKGGVSIDETKRAELIAALHQTATFGEGLLNQSERLINALVTGENRPDAEGDRLHARKAGRWREQMTGLWQRIAGMTMERPGRLQPHRPVGAGCTRNSQAVGNTTRVPCPIRLPGGRETPSSAHQFML
jgi:hypothetical protein